MNPIIMLQAIADLLRRSKDSSQIRQAVSDAVEIMAYDQDRLTLTRLRLRDGFGLTVRHRSGLKLPLGKSLAAAYLFEAAADPAHYLPERLTAVSLLSALALPFPGQFLLPLARCDNSVVRCEALKALRLFVRSLDPHSAEVRELLRAESAPEALAELIPIAASLGPAVLPSLSAERGYWTAILDSEHRGLRLAVYRVLRAQGQAAASYVDIVTRQLRDETEIDTRIAQISLLAAIITDQESGVLAIGSCLTAANPRLVIAAFDALAALGSRAEAAKGYLTLALMGRHRARRMMASQALRPFGQDLGTDEELLLVTGRCRPAAFPAATAAPLLDRILGRLQLAPPGIAGLLRLARPVSA